MVVFVASSCFSASGSIVSTSGAANSCFPIGTLTAFGVGSVSALTSYYSGDRAVLLSTGAVPFDRALSAGASDDDTLKLRQLDNVVEEMSIAAGCPNQRCT